MAKVAFGEAQAKLLASRFLDSIGSNPDFSDMEVDASLAALIKLAGYLINEANDNLQQGGHVSSGLLSDSIKVLDPEYEGGEIKIDIEALYYYQFLNKGVRGTRGGSGQYAFKSAFPSKKMVEAIRGWLKRAGDSTANVKKSVSKLEVKNVSISQFDKAYAVARAIKMKGIRKTGFFDKAVQSAQSQAQSELGKALRVDIINSLPKTIDNGNSPK